MAKNILKAEKSDNYLSKNIKTKMKIAKCKSQIRQSYDLNNQPNLNNAKEHRDSHCKHHQTAY